jgi:hypothetical protein
MFRMICNVVMVDGPVRVPGQGGQGGAPPNPLMVKVVMVDRVQIIPVALGASTYNLFFAHN